MDLINITNVTRKNYKMNFNVQNWTLFSSVSLPILIAGSDCWRRRKVKKEKNIQQAQKYINKIKLLPSILNGICNHPFTDNDILSTKQAVYSLEDILVNYFKVNCFQQNLSYFKNFLNDLTCIQNKIKYKDNISLIFNTIYNHLPQDIIEDMKLEEGLSDIKEHLKKLDNIKRGLVHCPQNVHYIEINKDNMNPVFLNFLKAFEKKLNLLLKNLVKYIEAHKEKDKKSLREIIIKERNKILAEREYCSKARAPISNILKSLCTWVVD